jgi:cobalt/nickel transport system permease protein
MNPQEGLRICYDQQNRGTEVPSMHMADALLSPAVGATMWAVSGTAIAASCRKVERATAAASAATDPRVPMMGVLGAFVFAAQMINFTIPGTGSSGHLGGGLLLAILLGPHAGFLTIASVLVIQALFFADGGLLALGANIFNLGVVPCFVAYPLVFRPIAGDGRRRWRTALGIVVAAIVALQLGAAGVVAETMCSGISELPAGGFLLLMLPIHLAIGLVEGLATAGVVASLGRLQPGLLQLRPHVPGRRRVLVTVAAGALLVAAALSWFASSHPDGLEWSIARLTGAEELQPPPGPLHQALGSTQERSAILPDYSLPSSSGPASDQPESWPAVDHRTSLAGVVGGLFTLALVCAVGLVLSRVGGRTTGDR